MVVLRQDMRDVLVWPHHQATVLTVDTANGLDVLALNAACAKGLFVVTQLKTAHVWREQLR